MELSDLHKYINTKLRIPVEAKSDFFRRNKGLIEAPVYPFLIEKKNQWYSLMKYSYRLNIRA